MAVVTVIACGEPVVAGRGRAGVAHAVRGRASTVAAMSRRELMRNGFTMSIVMAGVPRDFTRGGGTSRRGTSVRDEAPDHGVRRRCTEVSAIRQEKQ